MQREAGRPCSHGGRGTRSANIKSVYELAIPVAPAIALALVATGCEPPASLPAVSVVDSAGVRIVDLGPVPRDLAKHRILAAEPDLVIRSDEDNSASVFSDVRDVAVLSGGRVAVVNGSGNDILVFDAAGRHIDTWGGSGDGPGEFRYLEWLAFLSPDSLAAGDGGLRRVTVFDAVLCRILSVLGRAASSCHPTSTWPPPGRICRVGCARRLAIDWSSRRPSVVA